MTTKEEEEDQESWFAEEQKKVEERYRKNKEARMREMRERGIKVMPDFRTVDDVVDYYARIQEEQGPGIDESIEEEEEEDDD